MIDLRSAHRQLTRQRGAALTLIIVLGLTMGIAGAAADVIAAFLWRSLPYPHSERLVVAEYPRSNSLGPRDLERIDWSGVRDFADLAIGFDIDSFTILGADTPFAVDGRWIDADVFETFGVHPVIGRSFTREEAERGDAVALIGYDAWQQHYQARASAIGESIVVRATLRQGEAEQYTIIGVLPRQFWHLEQRTELVLPRRRTTAPAILRLNPGATADQAADTLTAMIRRSVPGLGTDWKVHVQSAREAHVSRIRSMLVASGWAVALVAAVAVASLMFLQIARGVSRQREFAVRSALGATRRALVAELVGEGFVIGLAASVVALATMMPLVKAGAPAIERYLGRLVPGGSAGLGTDPVLLVGTAMVSAGLGVFLAIALLAASHTGASAPLTAGHASATDTPTRAVVRQTIAAAQLAVAFCLLVVAALMVRTAWHLAHLDLGFEPRGVLSANVTLHESAYRSVEQRHRFYAHLIDRVQTIPGVAQAALTDWLPFRIGPAFSIEPEAASGMRTSASIQGVSPEYFAALQIGLLEGRLLTRGDSASAMRVAIVSRRAARLLWPAATAVGQTFRIRFSSAESGRPGFGPFTVVGVVEDSLRSLTADTPPQIYFAFAQQPLATNAFLQIRTTLPPLAVAPAVSRAVAEADPTLAMSQISSLDAIVAAEGLRPRLLAQALTAMALIGSVVAIVGLYAVSRWMAQQRQREAALRIALGATPNAVAWLLAWRGTTVVGAGLAMGWWGAGPLSRLVHGELAGVAADDLATRLTVSVVLAAVSAAALLQPARRVAGGDLMTILRAD